MVWFKKEMSHDQLKRSRVWENVIVPEVPLAWSWSWGLPLWRRLRVGNGGSSSLWRCKAWRWGCTRSPDHPEGCSPHPMSLSWRSDAGGQTPNRGQALHPRSPTGWVDHADSDKIKYAKITGITWYRPLSNISCVIKSAFQSMLEFPPVLLLAGLLDSPGLCIWWHTDWSPFPYSWSISTLDPIR